jgi:glycosyltransferase involved in cell wall biosynthesis
MRVLFLNNYYPPFNQGGGYMQLCEEVAEGLSARGYPIAVLTSVYGANGETDRRYPVWRLLGLDPDWHSSQSAARQFFVDRRRRERQAVADFHRLVAEFRPDVIFAWHYRGLPRMLLHEAEQLSGVSVAYYLADYTPEWPDEYIDFWEVQPVHWTAKLFKRPLAKLALHILAREGKPISLEYEHVVCVSDYVRRRLVSQDLISADAVVIHNGVDLSCFSPNNHYDVVSWDTGLRCLVAGRVVADKGIHTVIEALAHLHATPQSGEIRLTV